MMMIILMMILLMILMMMTVATPWPDRVHVDRALAVYEGGDVVLQLLAGPAFGPTVFVDLVGDGTVQKSPSSACFAGVLLYTMTS